MITPRMAAVVLAIIILALMTLNTILSEFSLINVCYLGMLLVSCFRVKKLLGTD